MKKQARFLVTLAIAGLTLMSCQSSQATEVVPVIDPGEQIPDRSHDRELVRFFTEFFQKLANDNNFNGVVLFSRGDQVFFHRAYGIADRASGERITLRTRFNMASASKMFTTVGVAKLAEEGRLKFDDPIGKHLDPGWVSEETGRKILVRHLLSHTSGLGQYWDEWDQHSQNILILNDYKKIISDKLTFEPGTKGQYSNTGFILLGAIIESLTGRSYYDYVDELIFRPLHMTQTGFFRSDEPEAEKAVGYYEDKEDHGILKNNLKMHGIRGASAGGAWSTASDMHIFMRALDSLKLISAGTLAYLTTPNRLFKNYGYGLQVWKESYGHWGGFPGVEAFIMSYPKSRHVLVVFSNYYDSCLPLLKKFDYIRQKISADS